jgi:hypothetical protein
MKQIVTLVATLLISYGITAQDNAKYVSAMQKNLTKMSAAKSAADYQNVYNTFDRIAANTPNEWEASYYMAFIKTIQAFESKDKGAVEENLSVLTEKLEMKAEMKSLAENPQVQSEIHALIAMMYSARMSANPMELGPKFMPLNGKHLGMAEQMNGENPRVYLLYAQNLYYTPEAFGGNKRKAKDMARRALELYKQDGRKENKLMPHWGKDQAESLIQRMEKEKEETK